MRSVRAFNNGQTQSLTQCAYQFIKEQIISCKLGPGESLSEKRFADELGISRTPVREALQELARDGFVIVVPKKGTFVSELSVEDIQEIYYLREVIEGLAARLAAPVIDPKPLTELDEEFAGIGDLAAQNSWKLSNDEMQRLIDADFTLHDLIIQGARSPRLLRVSQTLNDQVQRTRVLSTQAPGRVQYSVTSHRGIIDALCKRDGLLAERLVREHVADSREVVVEMILRFRLGRGGKGDLS